MGRMPLNGATDFSGKMKDIASQVMVFSALALLGGILSMWNNPRPMGEMGHFMHAFSGVTVCFGVWGLATGVGLWRKWPWARICSPSAAFSWLSEPFYLRS